MAKLTVVEPQPADEFRRLLEAYVQEKRAERVSKKTLKIYRDAVEGVLFPFCEARGITGPAGLVNGHLNDLSVGLLDGTLSRTGRPLAAGTVHSYMRAINSYLRWAGSSGKADVTARGKLPRMGQRTLDVLSREEIARMETVAKSDRDKLIIRVLADTGLRLGELLKLTAVDIQPEGRGWVLRILGGKGDRDRLVPVERRLALRLRSFATQPRRNASSERIFLSLKRRPDTGEHEPLSQSGAEQVIHQVAEEAGIAKRVYPHLLRHSFATHALRRNMQPVILKQILGHSSLAMIDRTYSHLVVGDAQKALMAVLRAEDDD